MILYLFLQNTPQPANVIEPKYQIWCRGLKQLLSFSIHSSLELDRGYCSGFTAHHSGNAQNGSRALNRDIAGKYVIFETKKASPSCLHRKKAQYYVRPVSDASNCSSQVLLHRSWAPAKKKRYLETDKDTVKQSKNAKPNETVVLL